LAARAFFVTARRKRSQIAIFQSATARDDICHATFRSGETTPAASETISAARALVVTPPVGATAVHAALAPQLL